MSSAAVQEAVGKLRASLDADPDNAFAPAPPLEINDADNLALLSVPVVGDVTDEATVRAVRRLRDDYVGSAFRGVPVEVLVGG